MGLIYKIACDINDKVYIGQTRRSLKRRMVQHKSDLKNKRYNSAIHNAIRKYGWEHFIIEILEDNIPLENLSKREIYWVNKFNALAPNGYNLEVGDEHRIFSEETRKKMSLAKIGKSSWAKGKSFSKEHKMKFTGKNNSRSKVVLCFDLNNNFIKEYDCIMDAERELGLQHTHISDVCKGKYNKTGNYKFKYK